MKATLEFNLPEDQDEHRHAVKGTAYWCALWEIRELCIRRVNKNGPEHDGEAMAREVLNEIEDRLPGFGDE